MSRPSVSRALCLAGVLVLLLALAAPVAAGQSAGTRLAQQSLPNPDKPAKSKTDGSKSNTSGAKKLPKTGLSALPLFLMGLALIAGGRKTRPKPRPRPTSDRYRFELQRRRYLSERA
jgi:hypothetical protein